MKICEFRPIGIDDVSAMTDLLIGRQNIESDIFPFLKNSCLNPTYIINKFKELFINSKVIGIGAFDNGELVGYIMGEIMIDTFRSRGRHISVPYEGIAIRVDQSSELIRNLYAKVSVLWLEQGCFSHYTLIPLGNQVYYEAFLGLSFFIQQVHGIMNMEEYKPFENVSDAEIRVANKMDSEIMGNMSSIVLSYLNMAPTFLPAPPEVVAKINEGFKRIDDDETILIAEKDMKELGFQLYGPITPGLMSPDDGVELTVAGTYHSQMGSGIGKKLMNEGHRIMKEKGYNNMETDWRITNLAASTFWPKCGFKPIAYRMVRCIDNNIASANFNNPSINQL